MKRVSLSDGDRYLLGKILLVGNTSVGKSSLLYRLTEGAFNPNMTLTVGVEFASVSFEDTTDKTKVKSQIWDCAGQYRFQNIVNSYFHQADVILFVFDLSDPKSYFDIKGWIERASKTLNQRPCVWHIIGNKLDLVGLLNISDIGCVESVVAREYAKSVGAGYSEMSAKDSGNAFEDTVAHCLKQAYDRHKTGEKILHSSVISTINLAAPKRDEKLNQGCCIFK